MNNRIIKDIRYCESSTPNIEYNSLPDSLGKLFHPATDTNYLGHRIARKLNELNFSYGEFDHIYINLTTILPENDLVVSQRNVDKTIKFIDYGLQPATYNVLDEAGKNKLLKSITFRILKHISFGDAPNLKRVEEVEDLTAKLNSEMSILYKTKETGLYKVEIRYQINPASASTRAIVEYTDKKNNSRRQAYIPLAFYEDVYTLIDTITVKKDILVFTPKKSYRAELNNDRYTSPIELSIPELERL
jgi:hypothetical protein